MNETRNVALLFGYAATFEVYHVSTVVLDLDRTQESRELVARFTSSNRLNVVNRAQSQNEIEAAIDRGDAAVGLVIHAGFANLLRKGQEAPLQVLSNELRSGAIGSTASPAQSFRVGTWGHAQMVCEHRAALLARANVLFEDATLRSACRAQSAIARVLPRVALRSGAVDPIAQTGETFVQPAPEGDSSFNAGIDIDRAEFADVFLPRLAIDAACARPSERMATCDGVAFPATTDGARTIRGMA